MGTLYIWSSTHASHSPVLLNIPDVLNYRLQLVLTPYIWSSDRASHSPESDQVPTNKILFVGVQAKVTPVVHGSRSCS